MTLTSTEEIGSAMQEKIATLINQQGLGVLSTKDADGHPYRSQFARSPSCEVMAIKVTGFTVVQQFQNVSELRIDHDVDPDA